MYDIALACELSETTTCFLFTFCLHLSGVYACEAENM
jgi:hypothetical protein